MAYNKTVWVNDPATSSPINADNLNKIEQGIYDVDISATNLKSEIEQTGLVANVFNYNAIINPTSKKWSNTSSTIESYSHFAIPVKSGDKLKIVGNTSNTAVIAGLITHNPVLGADPDFSTATGWTTLINVGKNTTFEDTVPSDVNFLYVTHMSNSSDRKPSQLIINGIDMLANTRDALGKIIDDVYDEIEDARTDLGADISDLSDEVGVEDARLAEQIYRWNKMDLFKYYGKLESGLSPDHSITFTWDENTETYTVSGTSGSTTQTYIIWYDLASVPKWLKPGKKYLISANSTDVNVPLQIVIQRSGSDITQNITTQEIMELPEDMIGFGARFRIRKNTTVSATVSNIHMVEVDDAEEEEEDKEIIVTVKKDGTGDYTTIRGALESISNASHINPYLIEVYPGTYNLTDEYSDAEIRTAADNLFFGWRLTDGISIKGVGNRHEVILSAELSASDYDRTTIRNKISVLSVGGNMRMENLTLIARNIRYCVHDAFSEGVGVYKRIVKDMNFVASDLTSGNPVRTYGCGLMMPGENFEFENCDFGGDMVIHSNIGITNPTKAYFRNCRGRQVRMSTSGDIVTKHSFYFDGCNFESLSIGGTDTEGPQNIFAMAVGGNNPFMYVENNNYILNEDIDKLTVTSLAVGKLCKINNKTIAATNDKHLAYGVVVYKDSDFSYVQHSGFVNASMIGLTGLTEGDLVTASADGTLTTTGATESNAVGVVILNREVAFIKLLF